MKRALLIFVLAVQGCFAPTFDNGGFTCAAGNRCPSGFQCASDNRCYKNGFTPDLSVSLPDMAPSAPVDLAMTLPAADMSPDMANAPVDMEPVIQHQGQPCSSSDHCDNGLFCVDGVCCNSQCGNTCQACNVPGNIGICTDVGAGQNPVGARSCNAQAAATCGRDGTCDGAGNCRDWPSGTACMGGTCDVGSGDFTNPSTCNGTGTCVANGGGNCAPYKCQNATVCYMSCNDASECSGSNSCSGGSCGQLPTGRSCSSNAQCSTGNCVDGYCCNSSCASNCQACDVPGSQGTCTTVAAGSPHGTRSCTNLGQSPCGGRCDGTSPACAYATAATSCGQTCSSGQLQVSHCDGAGGCTAGTPTACAGNLACPSGGSACLTSCMGNNDCYPTSTYGCNVTANQCANYCVWDNDTWDDNCIWAP